MNKFKCDACGACCKNCKSIVEEAVSPDSKLSQEAQEEYKKFPYTFNEDGSCKMLVDNKCSVYKDRPTCCSVDKMKKHAPPMSRKNYHAAMHFNCEVFKHKVNSIPKK